ncbi:MAG: TonB-dependent receptor [Methylotenera sp.]
MINKQILLAVLAALPLLVQAEHLELDPVEVLGDANQASLTQKATAGGDSAKLTEALGVQLRRAGGVSSLPMLQGLADDRIRIKVDGMDLISSCANHMNPALSYIDPANIAQIKVYAGVTPVSVGGDSIAGSIVVQSEQPEFSKSDALLVKGQLSSFYRSNNDAVGGNISASVANEQVYMRYTGATVDANNSKAGGSFKNAGPAAIDRGHLDADEIGSTAYRSTNHALALGFKQDHHLLELKLGLQDIDKQGFVNQRMDMTGNQSEQYQLRYLGEFDWGQLQSRLYHERTQHKMQFGDDKQFMYGTAPGMPMQTLGKTTGFNTEVELRHNARDTTRWGADVQSYRLDDYWPASGTGMMMAPNTFQNINNGERDRLDVYGEWDATWSQQWFTQAGLRASQVKTSTGTVQGYNPTVVGMAGYGAAANTFNAQDRSETDHNIDMTLLARFSPDQTKTFQAGYAIKNRAPNLYERYTWANTNTMVMNMNNWYGDGNGYVGDINLKPETAHTFSLTADLHDAGKQQWQLNITPFYTYVQDYIDAVSCASLGKVCAARPDGFSNLSLDNQSAQLYGLDISAKNTLINNSELGRLSALAKLNYVRGKNKTSNDDLFQIMPLNAVFGLEQSLGAWENKLEIKVVDKKDHVQAIRKENKTAGYSIFNVYSSYHWQQAKLELSVENLFDKSYSDPLGGAYLGQGATMGAGVFAGTQVPGLGRSINIGFTMYH